MSGAALFQHLWQSTLCAAGAALVTLALRNNAARVRYWVWFAASVKFLIPFSVLSWLGSLLAWALPAAAPSVPQAFVTAVREVAAPLASPDIAVQVPTPAPDFIVPILIAIWAIGCLALLTRWISRWRSVTTAAWRAVSLNIEAPVPVRSTPLPFEPGVIGIVRPVLLLPQGIAERLTPAQLQAIVAHELCHIRRRDNLTAAIHMAVEAAFWFHPLVWWIGARLVDERERACDEAVLELGNESETYAAGILEVCRLYVESKLVCVAGVSGADLKRRIEVIMKSTATRPLTATGKFLLATTAAAACVLPVTAGLLSAPRATAQAAQQSTAPRAFEAVSIVRTPDGSKPWVTVEPNGRFTAKAMPLREVIAFAYDLDKSQVLGGPEWLDQPLYDITGQASPPRGSTQPGGGFHSLVKTLLAARFGLISHPESQTLSAFALRVDAGGSKLTPTPAQGQQIGPQILMRKTALVGTSEELRFLTKVLEMQLHQPVLDQTGLTGKYDFTLTGERTPDTLPQALREQLGLTLEPTTAPVEVLVVDGIQPPTLDAQPLPALVKR